MGVEGKWLFWVNVPVTCFPNARSWGAGTAFGYGVLFIWSLEASRGAMWAVALSAAETAPPLSSASLMVFCGVGVAEGEGGRRGAGAMIMVEE